MQRREPRPDSGGLDIPDRGGNPLPRNQPPPGTDPTEPTTQPGADDGGGGGGEWDFGSFYYPSYGGPMSPSFNFPTLPTFEPPEFKVPTFDEAMAEPGYQFRLAAGEQALQRAAAAQGVLRTGGTLKDLIQYGQNFGAAEYSNVFNRALQGYNTQYQAASDKFAPQMTQWQALAEAEQARGLANFQRNWDVYQSEADAARYADERMIQLALGM